MGSGFVSPTKNVKSGKVKSYRVRWRNPVGVKPNNPSRTFKTEREAKQACKYIKAHTSVGIPGQVKALLNPTLNVFNEKNPHPKHSNDEAKTREGRASRWKCWIQNTIGQKRIRDIQVSDIEHLLNAIVKNGKYETARKVRGDLCQVWKNAIRLGFASENPADLSILVKPKISNCKLADELDPIADFMTTEEVHFLVDAFTLHYRTLVLILCTIGLRIGEASALLVEEVNLDKGTLAITSTRSFAAKKYQNGQSGVRKSPKTSKSRRIIQLSPEQCQILKPLVEGRNKNEPLFTTKRGKRIDPHNFRNREWQRAIKKSGIREKFTPHDLRHYAASTVYQQSGDMAQVSQLLGHASIGITERIYVHLMPEKSVQVAATLAVIWPEGSLQKYLTTLTETSAQKACEDTENEVKKLEQALTECSSL